MTGQQATGSGKHRAQTEERTTARARGYWNFIFISLLPACLLGLTAAVSALANPYDDAMKAVRALSESPNVRLLPFGRSGAGRQIPAYLISDFSVDPAKKARVIVVAGQHGDEYNPVKSVLTLSRQLSSGSRDDLLRGCVVIVAPMVNPDGIAAHRRSNASGADINRDWLDRRTRETQYIHSIIKTWRPHLIIDAHEWTGRHAGPTNCVELPYCRKPVPRHVMGTVAKRVAHAARLALVLNESDCDSRLLHRRYALLGYASYLIETAYDVDYAVKARTYMIAIEQAAECVAADANLRSALSPAAACFSLACVSAYLEPTRTGPLADPEASALATLALMTAAYCLVMWIVKPLAATAEPVWSRRYRKCSVDWDIEPHPLLSKHHLQPLTSRSWTHRRIRARYAHTST